MLGSALLLHAICTLSDNCGTVLPSLPFIPLFNFSVEEFKMHLRGSSAEGVGHKRLGPDLRIRA